MSTDLHRNGKTSFYTNPIKMFNYYNIPFIFNHDNLDDTKITDAFCGSHAEEIYYPLETLPLQFTKA